MSPELQHCFLTACLLQGAALGTIQLWKWAIAGPTEMLVNRLAYDIAKYF